ncbi:MAG: hypothetical protein ACFB9N_12115 [Geitlerinemataceae cyanobacterium]
MDDRELASEKQQWLLKGVGGLLFVGAGLCVFGEALLNKLQEEPWFFLGTLSLVLVNFGLCMMFDSHNHQIRYQSQQSIDRE